MASSFRQTGRKIVAIGRNFADHAKELNNAVPTEPFFFLKPTSSYIGSGDAIEIPRGVVAHHEVELAVIMGQKARDIKAAQASDYIGGYALAIDMTARNVQDKAKKAGLPWSTAKGFDTFTPISAFVPKDAIADPSNVNLWLKVNDELRQNGNTQDMIFDIPALLAHVSSIMTLDVGDVILTGTPKGVSQISPGDQVTAGMQLPGSSKILAELKLRAMQREGGFAFQG
ncbi:acylpyruvate hydrolase [Malassezia brasiliensis]|uniref:Acylpyruvate hydrolase n=1 Tax=Malassezia brasiliensis TaxID=1821822 RepID=A0AAF0DQW2_9BASI|nr:acylpyruvate hydrolase [Malassezia brasiliensis]